MSESTWLPNLVGGVSIWKLAVDLNEPKFFDGRLLVPETEGSESLPVTVRWDLTGLTPLKEAQSKWPEEVGAAVRDFQGALDRVAKVFATPNSGFDKYKEAFTVPALDAEGSANYFYSPEKKKLFVINWGASPRAMGGKAEYVFGFQDWNRVFDHSAALSSAPSIAAATATGENPVLAPAKEEKKADEEKKAEDDPKKDGKQRPWWIWPLFALIAIALVLLALLLMRGCEEPKPIADASPDALVDGASDAAAEAGPDAASDAESDAASDASSDDGGDAGDASADAMAEAGDAGDGGDASTDGGDAGTLTMDDDDDDLPGGAGGGGTVIVKTFPGGGTGPNAGARTSVHRRHYHEDAVGWRVVAGTEKLARTEQRGSRYDVWLTPGKTFEGVKVEWQDKNGKWHPH